MPAGTITLTNNSTAVSGNGTAFDTELKANDFLVAIVGGTTYTLAVKSVESATALTLITAYGGEGTSGLAWTPVPNATLVGITAQVAADVAKAIRGLNLDKANWQQVFSGSGTITVSLPDGSAYSGPSWPTVVSSVSNKLDKSNNLKDLNDAATARSNLGLGSAATYGVGSAEGTVAVGNDFRITNSVQKNGSTMTGAIANTGSNYALIKASSGWNGGTTSGQNNIFRGEYIDSRLSVNSDLYLSSTIFSYRLYTTDPNLGTKVWEFRTDGTLRAPGTVYAGSTALTSDARLKSNFEEVDYSDMDVIDRILPQYYDKFNPDDPEEIKRELGIVAQRIEKNIPEVVTQYQWNDEYKDLRMVNYSAMSAWTIGYCAKLKDRIKEQEKTVKAYESRMAEIEARLKAIDGLEA